MPSSPQTVATTNVFDYLKDSANNPLRNQTVSITLQYGGAIAITPPVFIMAVDVQVLTDQNGFWQANLVPNGNLTPANTTYVVQVAGLDQYEIVVPASGPVQSSTIIVNQPLVLSPAPQTLTGPITVSGNETVTGTLTVNGATTLAGLTAGATTLAATSVGADLTILSGFRLLFGAAISKLVPGVTSFSIRDNADANDNLIVTNAGAVTVRNGLTVTAGGATITAGDAVVTAGRLLVSAAAAKILGGATSLSLRNNADTNDNVLVADAGLVTLRNALSIPPSAGGAVAATSFGSVPVKIAENLLGGATASVTFSSIPGGFRHLLLIVQARGDTAANLVNNNLQFNGDSTGGHYGSQRVSGNAATVAADELQTAAGAISDFFISAANSVAGGAGVVDIWIPNYAGTTFMKLARIQYGAMAGAFPGTTTLNVGDVVGGWNSTAAITSIVLAPTAGNYVTNSLFTLYGVP